MTNLLLLRPRMNFPEAMPNPPIGLGYLASIIREHGHTVHIIDCAKSKQSYSQIFSKIKKLNPDVIGLTALSSYYEEMRNLAQYLQQLEIPIILGGIHVSALPELSIRRCKAEFAVIGEGELTTLELMNKWQDEAIRKKIKGIAYIEDGKFIINPRRERIQKLDELPFPAWDLINPLTYPPDPHGGRLKRYPIAPILTTRGCPYSCSYCASTNFWGDKFRRRSPKNVVDEIEYLVNKFGIREIHIWDDNFTLVRKHVMGVCREIFKRKLDLTFSCPNGVRIDHLNKEILTVMRRAGFYSLTFAIESGVQAILDKANKNIDVKKIPKITKLAKSLGFSIPSYFIFGLPGETYRTARQTIEFSKKLPLDTVVMFIAKPLPGSALFEEWIQNKEAAEVNYDWFQFYVGKNELELTDGKSALKLPTDAYREFYLRPIQFFRYLKYIVKTFNIRQFVPVIQRMYRLVLRS